MFCVNCGKEMSENMQFCVACGTSRPQTQGQQDAAGSAPPQSLKPMRKSSNGPFVAGLCVAGVMLIAVLTGVFLSVGSLLSHFDVAIPPKIIGEQPPTDPGSDPMEPAQADNEAFIEILDELFEAWITEDTLTMNYYLADPEAMGIERPAATYGEVFSSESYEQGREETRLLEQRLDEIDYDMLSSGYRLIYDIIRRNIELSEIIEGKEEYSYYTGYIRPLNGIQIQLPVLLAEFNFHKGEDIDIYFELLADTVRYFDDIIEFERERAVRGYFMSDDNLGGVIEQLEAYTAEREDNFLITVVNDKLDAFEGLSDEQREQYKQMNSDLVLNNVLVAYDNLLEAMTSLAGVGPAPGPLAALPDGDAVAHAMLRRRAGTDRSADELMEMVEYMKAMSIFRMGMIFNSDEELMNRYMAGETGRIPDGTPEEYLLILRDAITEDFPPIAGTDYRVIEVHESLQDFISPAFFLVPAIDRFDDNVIYVNPVYFGDEDANNLYLFSIMAHEGFPGHMYEKIYSRQNQVHPIRAVLANVGYSEGWATYVEYMSYSWAGLDELEAALVRENNLYLFMTQGQIDLGVNVFGWSIDDVARLLEEELGMTDMDAVRDIYNSVTGTPLHSSMYALGYSEMMQLREEAAATWGDDFSLYAFHSFLLDFGPAPYAMIQEGIYR